MLMMLQCFFLHSPQMLPCWSHPLALTTGWLLAWHYCSLWGNICCCNTISPCPHCSCCYDWFWHHCHWLFCYCHLAASKDAAMHAASTAPAMPWTLWPAGDATCCHLFQDLFIHFPPSMLFRSAQPQLLPRRTTGCFELDNQFWTMLIMRFPSNNCQSRSPMMIP